jgi:hypothetical protein
MDPKMPSINPAVANPFPPWLGFFLICPSAMAEKTIPAGVPQQTMEVISPTIAKVFVFVCVGGFDEAKFWGAAG